MSILGICACGAKAATTSLRFEGDVVESITVCDECREAGNQIIQRMKPVRAAMDAAGVRSDIACKAMQFILTKMMGLPL